MEKEQDKQILDLTVLNNKNERHKSLKDFFNNFDLSNNAMIKFNDDFTLPASEFFDHDKLEKMTVSNVTSIATQHSNESKPLPPSHIAAANEMRRQNFVYTATDKATKFRHFVHLFSERHESMYHDFVEVIKTRTPENTKNGIFHTQVDPQGKGCMLNNFHPYQDPFNFIGSYATAKKNPDSIIVGCHGNGDDKNMDTSLKEAISQYSDADKIFLMGCNTGIRTSADDSCIEWGGFEPYKGSYMEHIAERSKKPVIAPAGVVEAKAFGVFSIHALTDPKNTVVNGITLDKIGDINYGYATSTWNQQTQSLDTQFPKLFEQSKIDHRERIRNRQERLLIAKLEGERNL